MIRNDFNILSPLQVRSYARHNSHVARVFCAILDSGTRPADLCHYRSDWQRLLSDADMGHGVEQSKYVAEPPQHANDDDCVQNRLDGTRHGDELINQP